MISTRNLTKLPDIDQLRRLFQSLAMLDTILSPEWGYRYYSFNSRWGEGEEMASMRNGAGDDYFALFNTNGAILKGFAHESPMSPYRTNPPVIWPGILDNVPNEFASFLVEPAFKMEDTTFCIWRLQNEPRWQTGNIDFPDGKDPDGSQELLSILDGKPVSYKTWAEGYYEMSISLKAVTQIYAHQPLTQKLVRALNDDVSLEQLQDDITEIGYPM